MVRRHSQLKPPSEADVKRSMLFDVLNLGHGHMFNLTYHLMCECVCVCERESVSVNVRER